jgi:stage III sporulation protein AD
MDFYFKALAGALIAAVLGMMLEKQGKEFSLLLLMLLCSLICILALGFLEPVMDFLRKLEELIPLEPGLLRILVKIAGISLAGELAGRLCMDSGSAAAGKAVQFLTNMVILWLSLPVMETMLELIGEVLEGI